MSRDSRWPLGELDYAVPGVGVVRAVRVVGNRPGLLARADADGSQRVLGAGALQALGRAGVVRDQEQVLRADRPAVVAGQAEGPGHLPGEQVERDDLGAG